MRPEMLPEYRVKARNTAVASENLIHDDAVARRYGFVGGLVPGVTVYAYLTHPLVETFGPAWLERGTASVRFVRPVIDGDEAVVSGRVTARETGGVTVQVMVTTPAAGDCAVATATMPTVSPPSMSPVGYGTASLPDERPAATRAHLASLKALGTPVALYDEARAAEYLERVSDTLPVYRGPRGLVHPAFYLDQANRALDLNVKMGPWVHVGSVIRHLSAARVGDTLETRGRVRALSERKERELVELDLLILAGEEQRPVAHVLHSAIYRLPVPPAA